MLALDLIVENSDLDFNKMGNKGCVFQFKIYTKT